MTADIGDPGGRIRLITCEVYFLCGARYLPLLLFDSEDEASIFCLQLLFESSQNRPVLPNSNTQSEAGT